MCVKFSMSWATVVWFAAFLCLESRDPEGSAGPPSRGIEHIYWCASITFSKRKLPPSAKSAFVEFARAARKAEHWFYPWEPFKRKHHACLILLAGLFISSFCLDICASTMGKYVMKFGLTIFTRETWTWVCTGCFCFFFDSILYTIS